EQFVKTVSKAERNVEAASSTAVAPFIALRQELEKPFAARLYLWRRTGGPKGDLRQELDTVVQVPGWSNIWTQPIANRIDMLSTGVRTPVGVKDYGPDLVTHGPGVKGDRTSHQADPGRPRCQRGADHGQGLPGDQ